LEGSEALQCANYSRQEWRVSLSAAGAVQITEVPQRYKEVSAKPELPAGVKLQKGMVGNLSSLRVQNGWLLGFDGGEYGGGLWFANLDGKTQKLSGESVGENVHGFIETSQGVLVFVGLAHPGFDSGKVLVLPYVVNSKTDVKILTELDGAPRTFTKLSPDAVLVATTQGISRITSSGVKATLLYRSFGGLYPNSVVSTPDGTIYAGMWLFVVRLARRPGGYREEWLIPDSCRHFSVSGYDCNCAK
jgi:hypothetical protein